MERSGKSRYAYEPKTVGIGSTPRRTGAGEAVMADDCHFPPGGRCEIQAHHERNQIFTVRPELVERLNSAVSLRH